jgi:hypothetical protein
MVRRSPPPAAAAELRADLLNLAVDCPFDHCNPADCPLFELRQLSPRLRRQWIQALTEADLVYLATYHHICLTTKMEATAAKS